MAAEVRGNGADIHGPRCSVEDVHRAFCVSGSLSKLTITTVAPVSAATSNPLTGYSGPKLDDAWAMVCGVVAG